MVYSNRRDIAIILCITTLMLCQTVRGDWEVVDWRSLPTPKADDKIAVHYLVAPLLEDKYNNLFSAFKLYHAALGFTNTNTNFSVTMDYDADDFVRASLFPTLVYGPNKTVTDLEWNNGGANYIYLGINNTYWSEGETLIGYITGDIYYQFLKGWNAKVNDSKPYYDLFAVADHWQGNTFISSWDCFDFVFDAIRVLQSLGANFDKQLTLNKNIAHIYANSPTNVTSLYDSDDNIKSDILRFYEFTQLKFGKGSSVWDIIKELLITFEGHFYYRVSEDYYQLKLNFPYFGISWWPVQPLLTLDRPQLKF